MENKEQIIDPTDKILFNFVEGGAKVEIHGNEGKTYKVSFIDSETTQLIFQDTIQSGHWTKANPEYFVKWRIIVEHDDNIIKDYTIDLTGRNVLISYESSALGDTIAWMPYVEEFRKKHNCNLMVSSFHNEIFKPLYPQLNYIERGVPLTGLHFVYRLGWFGSGHASNKNPRDCHSLPLQAVATDILGLEYKEIRATLRDNRASLLKGAKYVAITTCSTAQFKYWNADNGQNTGWQGLVNNLTAMGYKVVNVGKQPNFLKNVVDLTGPRPMADLMNIIQNSEFFVGLPSGLCWLAWALGKKTVMITGISKDFCEYREDCYRVENLNVCHGCFNDPKYTFDKGDWLYCPINKGTAKHFECTKTITPAMVMIQIKLILSDIRTKTTHFSMSNEECNKYLDTIKR